jgi:CRISPR-associated endonuclease/helicase Cas3
MNYDEFFRCAFGRSADKDFKPFEYQRRLAIEPWPDLLDVPTGMGKTATVVLAWLWKRGWRAGQERDDVSHDTPRRLVWCLPMRVLVEQTADNVRVWLSNLGLLGNAGEGKVSVQVLMGGESDLKTWAEYPEEDMILIGTQDMLLSRVLMRGYGMSRYQWPIHFALLHNDCLWAFDEVQLMGAGLATSTQLEAFRHSFTLAKGSRSLWVSATLNRAWLETVDFKPYLNTLTSLEIDDKDRQQAGDRLRAAKRLEALPLRLDEGASKKEGLKAYLQALCKAVVDAHDGNAQTLVIVNRVDRAQGLFRLLCEQRPGKADLLIHARFRAAERAEQTRRLRKESSAGRIIVATQAIEAGVDISSKTLVTELAPWASLVQRFGRCNRYGEYNAEGARIFWVDIADDADALALPYATETLASARVKLANLDRASPQDLPATDEARPLTAVLRRRDLLGLFNTDPDLSGFDVDVSDYIRDNERPGLQVFWRDFDDDPNDPQPQGKPNQVELCPISMGQARSIEKRGAWYWDSLGDKKQNGRWMKLERDPRPGMVLLLRAADGCYDDEIGFDANASRPVEPVVAGNSGKTEASFGEDWRSRQNKPIALSDHLGNVAAQAGILCDAVEETRDKVSVVRAARWHDLGKAHEVFDATMHACDLAPAGFLAKSPCAGKHGRPYFRHELASMLAWLAQHDGEPEADLVAYLIAAHHGKVRTSLRAMPTEEADTNVVRFARGVWEGDLLPALSFDGEYSKEITLKLALMEIGEGEQGASWSERTLTLLDQFGPFRLAWLETLVRLADWRASAEEQT